MSKFFKDLKAGLEEVVAYKEGKIKLRSKNIKMPKFPAKYKANKKEIEKELKIALKEVGKIKPVFDEEVGEWVFSFSKYPVECGGEKKEDVKKAYPLYLKEFIEERMMGNLNPQTEKKTSGRGGYRPRAGRPKGTKKEEEKRVYVPVFAIILFALSIILPAKPSFLKISKATCWFEVPFSNLCVPKEIKTGH